MAQRYTSAEIKDKGVYFKTICDYNIRTGKTDKLTWLLPLKAKEIQVKGPGVNFTKTETQGKYKKAIIDLTSSITGQYRLELNYYLENKDQMSKVITAQPQKVLNEDEYLILSSKEELQIVPVIKKSWQNINLDKIPQKLVNITKSPILKAYHCLRRDKALQPAFIRYNQAEGVETAVDEAQYNVYLSPQGQQIVKATFEVRNTHNQFMKLKLPLNSLLC